jgi:hypothetical protein
MGQYCQCGFEFTFSFSLTKEMTMMYDDGLGNSVSAFSYRKGEQGQ